MSQTPSTRLILDVRTPAEVASTGVAPGAQNIEYQNVSQFILQQHNLSKDNKITLYCRSGRRSAIAKDELENLGFTKVRDLGTLENARSVLAREEASAVVLGVEKEATSTKKEITVKGKGRLERSTAELLRGLSELEGEGGED